jgi:hypothetical protein
MDIFNEQNQQLGMKQKIEGCQTGDETWHDIMDIMHSGLWTLNIMSKNLMSTLESEILKTNNFLFSSSRELAYPSIPIGEKKGQTLG